MQPPALTLHWFIKSVFTILAAVVTVQSHATETILACTHENGKVDKVVFDETKQTVSVNDDAAGSVQITPQVIRFFREGGSGTIFQAKIDRVTGQGTITSPTFTTTLHLRCEKGAVKF